MFKDKKTVDDILSALGEEYAELKGGELELVVCGGSALQALGLVSRTTKDVDVLARLGLAHEPLLAEPLPPLLLKAVQQVAKTKNLTDNWLNPGPTSAVTLGLPAGLVSRAEQRHYGSNLTILFISRYDQIHLKLYAAADHGASSKHYQDLLALTPTAEEIEAAAKWTLTHDASEGFKQMLKEVITSLGYKNVAERI